MSNDESNLNGRFVEWRGRQWAVTEEGLECLDGTYPIDKDRLLEDMPDWSFPEQLACKNWTDLDDFIIGWLIAIALHAHPRSEQIHEQINKARLWRKKYYDLRGNLHE